jgi:hypothetical protein
VTTWQIQNNQISTETGFSVNNITSSTTPFFIGESGRVGIGTTSPGSALEINAAAATSPFIAKINTAEAARIDSSGRLLIGTSTSVNVGTIVGTTQQIAGSGQPLSLRRFSNSAVGPNILFGKTRATTDATYTIVQNGDTLGGLVFAGSDGVDLETPGASIVAEVDGTPGANDMPGRLVFSTTADGASSPTERVRLDSSGRLLVGTTTTYGNNAKIESSGSIQAKGAFFTETTSSAFTANQTISVTAPSIAEGACYQVTSTRHTGAGNSSVETGYVSYSSNGTALYTVSVANANITVSVSGSTISAANDATNAVLYLTIAKIA